MIVVLDSTALALLINPDARPPDDPATGKPVLLARERVTKLVCDLDAKTDVLVIPTPVLAEVLVRAEGGAPALFEQLRGLARVRVQPFNQAAAIEVAAMTVEAKLAGDKKGGHTLPWQRVKFDRQIIATARVAGASRIYSDDCDLVEFARRLGMDAFSTWELPAPASEANLFTAAGVAIEPKSSPPSAQPLSESLSVEEVASADQGEDAADRALAVAENDEAEDATGSEEPDQGDSSAPEEQGSEGGAEDKQEAETVAESPPSE